QKTAYEAESDANTLSGNATVGDCAACSGGSKVGNLYQGGKLRFHDVVVRKPGRYVIDVAYVSGDPRTVQVSANGNGSTALKFPSTGDWGSAETIGVPVTLKAGSNTVTFDSGDGYAPDIDRIAVPKRS
ncbi:carbohydrate-binding protein, partial [Streptomyces sp. NPDC046853]|uniref:carbohydrate-binding protein n=1 Tax=Streptomyces sp. NPDC046853 TaxID=3154920 RepID=UPI0033D54014